MTKCSPGSPSSETLFDVPAKQSQREQLTAKMGEPGFWDNPEKAQQVINQLKPLNGLLKPYEELEATAGEVRTMAELAEEDPSFEEELTRELGPFEKRLAEFDRSPGHARWPT